MAKFIYKAKKGIGQTLEGAIEADSQEDALSKLTEQGLFPVTITAFSAPRAEPRKKKRLRIVNRKVTSSEILSFVQKLTTLMRSKVELISSLKILYEQTENIRFKEVILEIYNGTKEGKTFSDSLKRFPDIFSSLFVNIIKAGEATGRLDSSLQQISDFLYRQENLRTKVSVALAYPALLLSVGLISIFVLMNFVVPRLRPLFEDIGKDLPLITKVVLKVSALSNKSWWIILVAVLAIIVILYRLKGGSFFRYLIIKLKINLPILKRLTQNQELANFSRSLSLLLNSGVPALKSLEIAIPNIENPKLRQELKNVSQKVASGEGLAKSMEALTGLPDFFTKMIAVGEESGRLVEVLDEAARSYTQQIETDITLITSLLEPILILVLGIILGAIVLSIFLPTFQITQLIS